MSFRKEKKYKVTKLEYCQFQRSLFDKGMKLLHPKRRITSIYFDNYCFAMFEHSEEGLLPRKKIRIRWYDEQKKFVLEKKISSLEGRYKTTRNLIRTKNISSALEYKITDPLYGNLKPSLKIAYKRSYFTLNTMRITFDTDISYKSLRQRKNIICRDPEEVIEVKVSSKITDDFIQRVIPNQSSRFSKYTRGINMVRGHRSPI